MKIRTLCLSFAVGLSIATAAHAMTGMDLYNQCGNGFKAGLIHRGECHNFIVGVAGGLVQTRQLCFQGQLGGEQGSMIVQAYMRSHPDELGADAATIVARGLHQAYPCP